MLAVAKLDILYMNACKRSCWTFASEHGPYKQSGCINRKCPAHSAATRRVSRCQIGQVANALGVKLGSESESGQLSMLDLDWERVMADTSGP